MRFARFFVLGVLLISPAWPAAAYSFPAVSVQHLLTDKDCETVPDLLGDWEARGDLSGIWAMQNLGDKKYRLIEKGSEPGNSVKGAFDICLAHLGGNLFFDATSQKVRSDEEEDFWIPLHVFGRLEVKDDRLNFLLLEDSWLQDELRSGRLRLTCSLDDEGQYLLTAPSKELKLFASHYANDPKAFSYKEDFERVPAEVVKHRFSRSMLLTDPKRSIDIGNRCSRHPSRRSHEPQTILLSREPAGDHNHDNCCDRIALDTHGTTAAESIRGKV